MRIDQEHQHGPYRSPPQTATVWKWDEGNCIAYAVLLFLALAGLVFFFFVPLPCGKPIGGIFLFSALMPTVEAALDGAKLAPGRWIKKQL